MRLAESVTCQEGESAGSLEVRWAPGVGANGKALSPREAPPCAVARSEIAIAKVHTPATPHTYQSVKQLLRFRPDKDRRQRHEGKQAVYYADQGP